VSRGGGTHPRWTADGRRLVYWARPGGIMSVDVASVGASPHLSEPKSVIPTRVLELIDGRPHYDVTRDGRRYLLRQPSGAAEPPIGVIVNWVQRAAR
jgi:Tol biopolymer transport system component